MRKIIWFVVIFFFLSLTHSLAQCAMCRATVENNISNGNNIGSGLNAGILYLAAMPYVAIGLVVFFWYRNSKKNYGKRFKNTSYTAR